MNGFIKRTQSTNKYTFGSMSFDDSPFNCLTLERPWAGNINEISCIPCGTYICKKVMSHHFRFMVYEITGVPNRTLCEIHPANKVEQVEGCIAVGDKTGIMNNEFCIEDSKNTFDDFMTSMVMYDEFPLTIEDA